MERSQILRVLTRSYVTEREIGLKLIKCGMMSGSGAIGGQMAVTSSPHPLLATDVSVSVLCRPHCALSYSLISA